MYDIYIMVFSTERKFVVNSLTNYSCCFNIWYMYICIQQNMLFGLFQKQFIKSRPSSYTCTVNTKHTGFCWTFSHSVLSDFFYIQFVSVYHHRPNASSDLGVILPSLISALSCLLFQVLLFCLCFGSSLGDHNGSLGLINYKLYTARSYLKNVPGKIGSDFLNFLK